MSTPITLAPSQNAAPDHQQATLRNPVQLFQGSDDPSRAPCRDPSGADQQAQVHFSHGIAPASAASGADGGASPDGGATLRNLVQPFFEEDGRHPKNGAGVDTVPPTQSIEQQELATPQAPTEQRPSLADDFEALLQLRSQSPRHAPGQHAANGASGGAGPSSQAQSDKALASRDHAPPKTITSLDAANALIDALVQRWENPPQLSDQQQSAIELILRGERQEKIAQTLGVHRVTLWRWRRNDPEFRRALAIAREEALRHATEQLREFVPKALEIVQSQLHERNFQAALHVLRLVRIDRQEPLPAYPMITLPS